MAAADPEADDPDDQYVTVRFDGHDEDILFPQDGQNDTAWVKYFTLTKLTRREGCSGRRLKPSTRTARRNVEPEGPARPEQDAIALDPVRWEEALSSSTAAHLMGSYLRERFFYGFHSKNREAERFTRTTSPHDKHTVLTCLESLSKMMHFIVRYPGACRDEDWVKSQRALLQRLLLLEYKNEGMSAASLTAVDTAFRDEEQPPWVRRGRDRAVASLKVLTHTQGRGQGQSQGRGRGRGRARGGTPASN
eukprot:PhM_4_TR13310/c0_g2_i1/m.21033